MAAKRNYAHSIAMLLMAAIVTGGCSQFRLPAIDPSGERVFLPSPSYTTLESPCDSIPQIPFGPTPAFTEPPPIPPCDPAVIPAPVAVAGPTGGAVPTQDRLLITPSRMIAPVGTEVVLLGGICGPDGFLVTRQPIEWLLSHDSVGNFVNSGEKSTTHEASWFHKNASRKLASGYVVTKTSTSSRLINRGTQTPDDDIWLKKGQSWVSVTSASAGVSYVTAVAPGAENWEHRRQIATIVWVDAEWSLPSPAVVRAGQPHVLTTTITRSSDNMPASNWIVRYEVHSGAPAVFGPGNQTAVEISTDANGRASVQVVPQAAQPGTTQVRVQILVPSSSGDVSTRVVVGQGWTTITWSAPGLTVRISGPQTAAVDATVTFRIEATNSGDLLTRSVVASVVLPPYLRFVNSNPACERFEPRVQWRLGDLGPRETRVMELTCRTVRDGDVRLCAQAQSEGGLTTEGCANLQISLPALEVRVVDPPATAKVGDSVTFNVEVSNVGSSRITNVVARDTFDAGLEHSFGESSPIVRSLGNLEPRAVSRFAVTFVARKSGRLCHTLDVTGDGGHAAVARVCVDVSQVVLDVQLTVTGPPQRQVGERAEFVISAVNTGQAPLTGVSLSFYTKPSLVPEAASAGYVLREGGLIWDLGTLQPNASQSRTVQCGCQSADAAGQARAEFRSQEGISRSATAGIDIREAAARTEGRAPTDLSPESSVLPTAPATGSLVVSIADTSDPIAVGALTSYLITVKNDRAVADRDVAVTLFLPEGLQFVRFDSGGLPLVERRSADGRTIALPPVKELRPGETLRTLRVEVKAAKVGLQKLRVEVTSLRDTKPVVDEEETTVQAN